MQSKADMCLYDGERARLFICLLYYLLISNWKRMAAEMKQNINNKTSATEKELLPDCRNGSATDSPSVQCRVAKHTELILLYEWHSVPTNMQTHTENQLDKTNDLRCRVMMRMENGRKIAHRRERHTAKEIRVAGQFSC